MKIPIKPYTTTSGKTIQVKTLLEVLRKLRSKEDHTKIISTSLQELFTNEEEEEQSIDEAYDIIDHCQDIINQEELEYYIEHTKHIKDYE